MIRISRSLLALVVGTQLFMSCGPDKPAPTVDSMPHDSQPKVSAPQNIEVKTFEVIDSVGKSHGWGYDLYVNGKKTIHQPIIPAVPGNNSFASESDARKIGDVAAAKMKTTGSLPTILVHDLDSLGIDHLK
jgi:hypothetical protein